MSHIFMLLAATANAPETLFDAFSKLWPWLGPLGFISTFMVNIMNNRFVADKEKRRIGVYQIIALIVIILLVLLGTILYYLGNKWLSVHWPAIIGVALVVNFNAFLVHCLRRVYKLENRLTMEKREAEERLSVVAQELNELINIAKREGFEQFCAAKEENSAQTTAIFHRIKNTEQELNSKINLASFLDGLLIIGINDPHCHVYKIENGQKHWIVDRTVFDRLGFKMEEVWPLPIVVIRQIQSGHEIT